MVISCDILPATGDESLVTDFVPVSPPRHLHLDTGELVVKPDAVQSCPPRNKKVKDKKGQGDGMERKAEKNVTETSEETFYVVLPSVIFFTFFLHMLECVDVCIKCLFFFFLFCSSSTISMYALIIEITPLYKHRYVCAGLYWLLRLLMDDTFVCWHLFSHCCFTFFFWGGEWL